MTESAERKTQNIKILERLDVMNKSIVDLAHVVDLFIQKQDGEHCILTNKLDEVRQDIYGDDKEMGIREKLRRLWDKAQSVENSSKAFYIAAAIMVISVIIDKVWK